MHLRVTPSARPRTALLLLGLLLAVGPLLLAARSAEAATTFTVTTTGDEADSSLTDPVCDVSADPGNQCTLRAAIEEANATPGPDTIAFNIPGGGVQTIRPASDLPRVTARVTIDGYTQPGSSPNTAATGTNAVLTIELDGSNAVDADGLRIEGSNSVVRGLAINRFAFAGIVVGGGASGVQVAGCFVGTDAAGTADLGNGTFGINLIVAPNARIGGTGPAARNLVSGNGLDGVFLNAGATGTRVLGNLIGTDKSGAAPIGNDDGVVTFAPAAFVGGATAAEANVIAFNDDAGVVVAGSAAGARVLRNRIFANDGIGIDLGDDGATANDAGDGDDGPNTLQNFPVITTATSTSVQGTLDSTPTQDFVLRLFSNPGTQNEGKFFAAGPLVVTTDANGDASFTFTPDPPIPAGRSVTATATNQGGSTSEFSAAVPVPSGCRGRQVAGIC